MSADSLTTQFQAFLSSSASVPGLGFSQSASHPSPSSQYPSTSNQKRLILVEDLPNIFTSTHTRESFRSALERFVHSSSAVNRSKPVPMVLIVSETTARNIQDDGWQASGWSRQDEGVSVRNLVPLDVLKGGRCTEIRCYFLHFVAEGHQQLMG